jgi:hypothetical protein
MSIKCNRCGQILWKMGTGIFKDENGYGVFLHRGCDCVQRHPAMADQYETNNVVWLKFRLEGCTALDAQGNTIEMDPEKILTLDYAPDGSMLPQEENQGAQEPIESAVPDDLPKCSNCESWMDERPAGENRGICCTHLGYTTPDEVCKSFIPGRRICERCYFWINDLPTESKGYCSYLETRMESGWNCIDFKRRID